MQSTRIGGCQCGAKRYSFSGPPQAAEICHCRMCQKAFGNWGAALIEIPLPVFQWTNEPPSAFRSSPPVRRFFCEKCGTPLGMQEDGDAFIDLAAATLDDPAHLSFTRQIGIESRLPWFKTLHTLAEKRTEETRKPEELARLTSLQYKDEG